MKKNLLLFVCFGCLFATAQNVGIGTAVPAAKLHIKGSADTSQLVIDANAIQSGNHPLIKLRNAAGADLMYIHSDDTSNVFIGLNAGRSNTAGNVFGNHNTFTGSNTGFLNTLGAKNTAYGYSVLYNNIIGSNNTASGWRSLYSNTYGGNNNAYGIIALFSNTTGGDNNAFGEQALFSNTTGDWNAAFGTQALYHNTTGNLNTAIGTDALANTTASFYNTAVGSGAGMAFNNGYNNVFIGANTDVNGADYFNVIAIGQGTICTGSSQVTIGNGATGSYRAYANWSNISDGRFKKNIRENVPGLDFITSLRPVTYNLKATELDAFLQSAITATGISSVNKAAKMNIGSETANKKALQEKETALYTGFVAQEVEAATKKIGFNFSGVDAPQNEKDVYGLRYGEFVVPLVKAVQEQQQLIKTLQEQNTALLQWIEKLEALVNTKK